MGGVVVLHSPEVTKIPRVGRSLGQQTLQDMILLGDTVRVASQWRPEAGLPQTGLVAIDGRDGIVVGREGSSQVLVQLEGEGEPMWFLREELHRMQAPTRGREEAKAMTFGVPDEQREAAIMANMGIACPTGVKTTLRQNPQ